MTRIEKFASYREEISNTTKLSFIVNNNINQISKYKEEINKINPSIINGQDFKNPIQLVKTVVNTNKTMKILPINVSQTFDCINDLKLKLVNQDVNELFFSIKDSNDLLDKNAGVKEEWLMQNPNYSTFVNRVGEGKFLQEQSPNIDQDLKNKFNDAYTETNFDVKITSKLTIINKKATPKVVFIGITLGLVCIIACVLIILFVGATIIN